MQKRGAGAEKDALKSRPPGTLDGARASEGVYWTPAHKDAGSRPNGWELLRERLKNVVKPEGPRLFVFNTCCAVEWTWTTRTAPPTTTWAKLGIRLRDSGGEVPQPLRASLSLRNTRFGGMTDYFGAGCGGARAG